MSPSRCVLPAKLRQVASLARTNRCAFDFHCHHVHFVSSRPVHVSIASRATFLHSRDRSLLQTIGTSVISAIMMRHDQPERAPGRLGHDASADDPPRSVQRSKEAMELTHHRCREGGEVAEATSQGLCQWCVARRRLTCRYSPPPHLSRLSVSLNVVSNTETYTSGPGPPQISVVDDWRSHAPPRSVPLDPRSTILTGKREGSGSRSARMCT